MCCQQTRGEIDPPDEGASINPLGTSVPALHAGRVEELLPLVSALESEGVKTGPKLAVVAGYADSPNDQFRRALHVSEPGIFEAI